MHCRRKLGVVFCAVMIAFSTITPAAEAATRTATPEEAAELRIFGISSTMIDDTILSRLRGGCEFNPYPILERDYKGSTSVQLVPRATDASGTQVRGGIAPALACRLVKFFQDPETRARCRSIKISSAYRSEDHQESICGAGRTGCAPPGLSCHQYGLAIDIAADCLSWMRQYLGTRNPNSPGARFKLHFPYYGPHIQCSENRVAACNTGTRGCDGSVVIQTDPRAPRAPLGLGDMARTSLYGPPPSPSTIPPSALPTSQSPLSAFQPIQPPSQPSASSTVASTNENINSNTPLSVADKLRALIDEQPTTTTQTATTVAIVITGESAAIITANDKTQQSTSTAGTGKALPVGEQTFTSANLAQGQGTTLASQSTFAQTLVVLRNALLTLLQYLRPFGRPIDGAQFVE